MIHTPDIPDVMCSPPGPAADAAGHRPDPAGHHRGRGAAVHARRDSRGRGGRGGGRLRWRLNSWPVKHVPVRPGAVKHRLVSHAPGSGARWPSVRARSAGPSFSRPQRRLLRSAVWPGCSSSDPRLMSPQRAGCTPFPTSARTWPRDLCGTYGSRPGSWWPVWSPRRCCPRRPWPGFCWPTSAGSSFTSRSRTWAWRPSPPQSIGFDPWAGPNAGP